MVSSNAYFIFADCLFGFYGISTFVGYLMSNPFHTNKQFYFKQFSLAWVHSLIEKKNSISSYSVLIQPIQFSISIDFVYPQLNVKRVLY